MVGNVIVVGGVVVVPLPSVVVPSPICTDLLAASMTVNTYPIPDSVSVRIPPLVINTTVPELDSVKWLLYDVEVPFQLFSSVAVDMFLSVTSTAFAMFVNAYIPIFGVAVEEMLTDARLEHS